MYSLFNAQLTSLVYLKIKWETGENIPDSIWKKKKSHKEDMYVFSMPLTRGNWV